MYVKGRMVITLVLWQPLQLKESNISLHSFFTRNMGAFSIRFQCRASHGVVVQLLFRAVVKQKLQVSLANLFM